jgi:hypothetical protein
MALYKGGGGYCFSCRKPLRGSISPYVTELDKDEEELIKLPDDASFDYSSACLAWVSKYGVSVDELIRNNVYWSQRRQQLLFTFWGNSSSGTPELLLFQARNFGPPKEGRKPLKYYTKGLPDLVLPVYGGKTASGGRLVLVEDCISAIKISRQAPAMPVLGSDLSLSKLKRLERALGTFLGASRRVVVWLDGNMYEKAQRMARRLQMLGVEAEAVYTELDPKEYDDETILGILKPSS